MAEDQSLPETKNLVFNVTLPPAASMPPALYANYAAANHNPYELLLDFAQIALPSNEDELKELGDNPVVTAKPIVRIAVPHALLDPLIDMLETRRAIIRRDASSPES